jgi:hypothetical protein
MRTPGADGSSGANKIRQPRGGAPLFERPTRIGFFRSLLGEGRTRDAYGPGGPLPGWWNADTASLNLAAPCGRTGSSPVPGTPPDAANPRSVRVRSPTVRHPKCRGPAPKWDRERGSRRSGGGSSFASQRTGIRAQVARPAGGGSGPWVLRGRESVLPGAHGSPPDGTGPARTMDGADPLIAPPDGRRPLVARSSLRRTAPSLSRCGHLRGRIVPEYQGAAFAYPLP